MAASASLLTTSLAQGSALLASCQSQLWGSSYQLCLPMSRLRHRRGSNTGVRASASGQLPSGEEVPSTTRKDAVRAGGLERRQLLVGASSAAAAAAVLGGKPKLADAEPIAAPNLALCKPSRYSEGGPTAVNPPDLSVQCCPPFDSSVKVVDFAFPSQPLPVRVRKAAHKLTDAEKATYEKAYARIKALPDAHPHSFKSQADVHCAYCNYGYYQQDGTTELQVHDSWLFLPFHRWYLYFHERILAKYADDPNFTLPFWNWDNQDPNEKPVPNEIPSVFLDPRYPTLKDAKRNTDHFPPNLVDFTRGEVPQSEPQKLRDCNTALLYQNLVDSARTSSLFFGGAYRAGDVKTPGGGTLEALPHGPPHGWTGGPVTDPATPAGEDMGNFYSAGRDPIFYSHHSNVDRMWEVWRTLPGRRGRSGRLDPDDPDFLNSSFLFYDENEKLTRVYTRDCLDTQKLGYKFAAAPDAWKDYELPRVTARPEGGRRKRREGQEVGEGLPRGGPRGDGPPGRGGPGGGPGGDSFLVDATKEGSSFKLARPDRPQKRGSRRGGKKSPEPVPAGAADDDDEEEEILVLQEIKVPINKNVTFDIFLDLDADVKNPNACSANYVGSYYNVPHGTSSGATEVTTNLRLGIGSKLKLLGITDTSNLVVTLVPRGETDVNKRIEVASFTIEYE